MPVGMMSPKGSYINVPVDLAVTVALPVHSHIACNFIISDYVPKAARGKNLVFDVPFYSCV